MAAGWPWWSGAARASDQSVSPQQRRMKLRALPTRRILEKRAGSGGRWVQAQRVGVMAASVRGNGCWPVR